MPEPTQEAPRLVNNPAEDYALLRKMLDDMVTPRGSFRSNVVVNREMLREALYKFDSERILRQYRAAREGR